MIQVEPCVIPQQDTSTMVRRLKVLGFKIVGAEMNDNFGDFITVANSNGLNVFQRVGLGSATGVSVASLHELLESRRIPKLLAVNIEEGIDELGKLSANQISKIMAIEISFTQLREYFNRDAYAMLKSLSNVISVAKLKRVPILYASYAKKVSELVPPTAYTQMLEITYGNIPLHVRKVLEALSEECIV